MKMLLSLGISLVMSFNITEAQDQGSSNSLFIYGQVTTIDGEQYKGQLRWGKEEAFWFDIYNSSKPENENLKYLTDDELDDLDDQDYRLASRWNHKWWPKNYNWNSDHTHTFACEFGEIASISMRSKSRVRLELRDGSVVNLKGGSNDINEDIQVNDADLGLIRLDGDRIDRVDFMDTPADLVSVFGEPFYGTVHSDEGSYQGYLQWDHDERLGLDVLDGDTRDGDIAIKFEMIAGIARSGRGAEVTYRSGRSLYISGSNDCNSGNRGIIVNIPNKGRVDIPWSSFDEMIIEENNPDAAISYSDFRDGRRIAGTVETVKGLELEGTLIFDLDEERDFELLNGMKEDVEFLIPFRSISQIQPVGRNTSLVYLNDGEKILLEDQVDVSEENDGVLIFAGNSNNPKYVAWEDVKSIKLH